MARAATPPPPPTSDPTLNKDDVTRESTDRALASGAVVTTGRPDAVVTFKRKRRPKVVVAT